MVRLGNFCNSEIFGTATELPWGVEFVRSKRWIDLFAPQAVHPTQLYEALCYLVTFVVLTIMYYRYDLARRRPGLLFGVGLIGIFLSRILIEMIKTTQSQFEEGMWLNMGQLLSIPFLVLAGCMIYRALRRPEVVVQTQKTKK